MSPFDHQLGSVDAIGHCLFLPRRHDAARGRNVNHTGRPLTENDMRISRLLSCTLAAAALVAAPALADDNLKLAVGAPGNWDTCIAEVGQRAGIFKKHRLTLELLYTQGGGETMQAVISGSVDIGGATGTSDLYWYVPANSPIRSFKDLESKTAGYSTTGASTHTTLLALMKHFGVNAKPIGSGAAAVTLTQAMSGQIDVGWASPPFGIRELEEGKIRIIARQRRAV